MSSPSPVRPAAIEIGEELLPFGGAFARRQAEIDDLLLAVVAQPQGHENRPTQCASAGLAGEHDAVEHQSLVAVVCGSQVAKTLDAAVAALHRRPLCRASASIPLK